MSGGMSSGRSYGYGSTGQRKKSTYSHSQYVLHDIHYVSSPLSGEHVMHLTKQVLRLLWNPCVPLLVPCHV